MGPATKPSATQRLAAAAPVFAEARPGARRDTVLELNVEYMSWLFEAFERHFGIDIAGVLGASAADYVRSKIDAICDERPPEGVFYLVELDGQPAGMGGLRRLDAATCEIKRIFVRPAFRGLGLGERILERLLDDGRAFGYQRARLESGPFMTHAHRAYERLGFVDREPYAEAEVPAPFHSRWRFMERGL